MSGIKVQTGELFNEMFYKCERCGILDETQTIVRPWFTKGKEGLCHTITSYSRLYKEDVTDLCGPVVKQFR